LIAALVEAEKVKVPVPVLVTLLPVMAPELVKKPDEESAIFPLTVPVEPIFKVPDTTDIFPV